MLPHQQQGAAPMQQDAALPKDDRAAGANKEKDRESERGPVAKPGARPGKVRRHSKHLHIVRKTAMRTRMRPQRLTSARGAGPHPS